jgi:hypothetical protein
LSVVVVESQGETGREALRDAVGTGEYFLVIFPDGSRLVQTISASQRHPIPFGREAAAQLAGVPERADWKNCQVRGQRSSGFGIPKKCDNEDWSSYSRIFPGHGMEAWAFDL